MSKIRRASVASLLVAVTLSYAGLADHDRERKHSERGHGHHGEEGVSSHRGEARDASPVVNETYRERCGGCHLAYPAVLLPSRGWATILEGTSAHFGQSLDLGVDERRTIAAHLAAGAADRSTAKLARRITESLDGRVPARITEVPYIQAKHRSLGGEDLRRRAEGSLANCSACHRGAESGRFGH